MRVRLEKKWSDFLVDLPESGMGYQRVDVLFADNRVLRDVPVFNAQVVELPEDVAQLPIRDVKLHRVG